jgi:peptidoglycan/LPS O-acetylase OafA/YrhL
VESTLGEQLPAGVAAGARTAVRARAHADAARLESLQIARAAAALAVIGWHLVWVARAFPGALPAVPSALAFGYAGVDLFFAISGYVICHITEGRPFDPVRFAARRWLRIAPLYAGFTALAALAAWIEPAWGGAKLSPFYVLHSISLLPMRGLPFLDVGWSLEHEVIFYALAGALLAARASRWLPHALALLFAAGVALHGFGLAHGHFDGHLFSLYHGEFLAGVWVFRTRELRAPFGWRASLAAGALLALAVSAFVAHHSVAADGSVHVVTQADGLVGVVRVLGYGAAAALILRGLLDAEHSGALAARRSALQRLLLRIGDASYVLYLSHFFVYSALAKVYAAFDVPDLLAGPAVALAAAAAVTFALAVHAAIERPLLRAIHSRV